MDEEHVRKFNQAIAPFLDLWASVRITCFAVRIRDCWVNLGTRVSLSELPPAQAIRLLPLESFSAVVVDLPITEVGYVLDSIVTEGFVPLATAGPAFENRRANVYLTRAHAGLVEGTEPRVSWFGTNRYESPYARRQYGVNRLCISLTAWSESIYDLVGRDLLDEASSKLRLREPPYDGVDALTSELLPGIHLRHQDRAAIQIVAPLPFDFEYSQKGALILRAPRGAFGGNLEVRLFFGPQRNSLRVRVDAVGTVETPETGIVRWESPIDWPAGSEWAKAILFYREEEIDTIEVNRWPGAGTLRIAVDSYFDPELKHLHELILGKKSKEGQNFEIGVVRLFNLLGVPVVWYGKAASSRRPDAAACVIETEGHKLVLLAEFTRERPDAKFSALHERARELNDFLQGEAEILPLVATPSEITNPDRERATEYMVCLIGRLELETLLKGLEARGLATPEEFIQRLRTSTGISFSLPRPSSVWPGPFSR